MADEHIHALGGVCRLNVFASTPPVVNIDGCTSAQNSRRDWNAIMRGVLSPPKPTPSKPVGGEVV